MEQRCTVCSKLFKKDEKPWGVRKIKGTWKTSPEFAEPGDNAYHSSCATRVAQELNRRP